MPVSFLHQSLDFRLLPLWAILDAAAVNILYACVCVGMLSLCGSHASRRPADEELPGICQRRGGSSLRWLQFLPFAFLAVGLSSQEEHSERLFPGGPGHGLVAGEFTHLLASALSTG